MFNVSVLLLDDVLLKCVVTEVVLLQRCPQPQAGGDWRRGGEEAAPPQEPHPSCRPFEPRYFVPRLAYSSGW